MQIRQPHFTIGIICLFSTALNGYLYVKHSFLFEPEDLKYVHGHFIDIELPHVVTHAYTLQNFLYALPITGITIMIMIVGNHALKQAFNKGATE